MNEADQLKAAIRKVLSTRFGESYDFLQALEALSEVEKLVSNGVRPWTSLYEEAFAIRIAQNKRDNKELFGTEE